MRKSKEIKVSVIVPVYNGEKWLNRCLQSLVNQTLEEIQIICVNDCSTDNSLAILQQYAEKDKRIIIKDLKKNGGESVARNNGLKIAKGEYVAFVDQDDYVDLNFYEELHKQTKNGKIDMVRGGTKTKSNGIEKIDNLNPKIITNKFYFFHFWWSAIYKNSFLRKNKIKLRENFILGADIIFLVESVVNANKLISVNNVFYHWIRRANSSYSKILNFKKINSLFKMCFYVSDYLSKKKIDKDNYTLVYYNYFKYSMSLFYRSEAKKRIFICENIIKLYKKCKYKYLLEKKLRENIQSYKELLFFFNSNDKIGLFTHLRSKSDIFYPEIKLNNQRIYIYVWGKGKDSEYVIEQCKKNNWNITAFLDSSEKEGTISPQKILKRKDKNYFIIISSRRFCSEITEICENAGLKEGQDFWSPICKT